MTKLEMVVARRKGLRLSLRKLAEKVGVSRQAVLDYERGIYGPGPEVWEKMKDVLGLEGEAKEYWSKLGIRGRPRKQKCKVAKCTNPVIAQSLCEKHYQKMKSLETN